MSKITITFDNPNDTIDYTPERPQEPYVMRDVDTEFLQLTYNLLRVGPHGDEFAYYDTERGAWRILGWLPSDGQWHEMSERASRAGYSDITIGLE